MSNHCGVEVGCDEVNFVPVRMTSRRNAVTSVDLNPSERSARALGPVLGLVAQVMLGFGTGLYDSKQISCRNFRALSEDFFAKKKTNFSV
jgi:hypothetical protein